MSVKYSQVASNLPFDNSTNGLTSDNTQSAIEEVYQQVNVSASPGFSFSRSGFSNTGTYLQSDNVPSNSAGKLVPVTTGLITTAFVACQTNSTFSLAIERRVGNTFTVIATISVSGTRKLISNLSGVSVAYGDELSMRVSSGSAQNIVAGLIIKGSI